MSDQPDAIYAAIEDAGKALLALGDAIDDAPEGLDLDAWAHVYRVLDWSRDDPRGLYQTLAAAIDEVKKRCYAAMPDRGMDATVEGIGTISKCGLGTKDRYDGPRLAHVIAARVADEAVDRSTGEIMPPGVLAGRVADELIDCAGLDNASFTGWRSGELKPRQINVKEYRDRVSGRPSVRWK